MIIWLFAFICFLVGVDREKLARCPVGDRDNVLTIGWLLILVWAWQLVVISVALHVGLAHSGEIHPEFIALATLVATLVLLFDSYLVRSSWLATGNEQLSRAGLQLPNPWATKVKSVAFFAVRLGVTGLLALLTGSLMSLILFKKDVEVQLAGWAMEHNAPVVRTVARRFDEETGRLNSERTQLLGVIVATDAEMAALRRTGLAQPSTDPEITLITDRVRDLTRRRDNAEDHLNRLRRLVDSRRLSGQAVSVGTARRELATLDRELKAVQDRLRTLQTRRDTVSRELTGTVDTRLENAKAARSAAQSRVAELDLAIARRAHIREAAVREAVLADPGYAPPDDGLLARLKALKALTADAFIFWTVLLLDAVFIAIELAAVFSKVMTFVPAAYALQLALDTAKAAHHAKEELIKALGLDKATEQSNADADPTASPSRSSPGTQGPMDDGPNDKEREAAVGREDDTASPAADPRLSEQAWATRAREEWRERQQTKPVQEPTVKSDGMTNGPTGEPTDQSNETRRGPGRPTGSKNKPKANGADRPDDPA